MEYQPHQIGLFVHGPVEPNGDWQSLVSFRRGFTTAYECALAVHEELYALGFRQYPKTWKEARWRWKEQNQS
jgi:hypothetical protein